MCSTRGRWRVRAVGRGSDGQLRLLRGQSTLPMWEWVLPAKGALPTRLNQRTVAIAA